MMNKRKAFLSPYINLYKSGPGARTLRITHFDEINCCILTEKRTLLIIQAAATSVNTDHKPALLTQNRLIGMRHRSSMNCMVASRSKSKSSF